MCLFFFKQKTAYEMRISDWSSDVCSSDLWYLGDHSVRFGVDFERNEIFNLFVQGAFGDWRFNSIDDFRNNNARSFLQRTPTDGNINSDAANWTLENYGFFLQDTWQVNNNLSLLLGVRWDVPRVPQNPPANQPVLCE